MESRPSFELRTRNLSVIWGLSSQETREDFLKTRMAFQAFVDSVAAVDDWKRLAGFINLTRVLLETHFSSESSEALTVLDQAEDSMSSIQARYKSLHRFGWTGHEMLTIQEAVKLGEQTVHLCTRREMVKAEEEVVRRSRFRSRKKEATDD